MIPPAPNSWIETPITPGPPVLIPGLLKRHGCLLIVGEHEIGKTALSLEVCHSVITGAPLWGKLYPTQTIPRVTFILGEHNEDNLREQWILMGYKVPERTIRVIGPTERKILVSSGGANMGNRALYTEWCKGSNMIVFDPLNAFITGVKVEDDNVQMRALINIMEDIATANGAALVILHHMGKPHFEPQSGEYKHREKYAARGASGIEDAVMACFYFEQQGGAHTGNPDMFTLRRVKYKGQAPGYFHLKRDGGVPRHTLIKKGLTPVEYMATRVTDGLISGPH